MRGINKKLHNAIHAHLYNNGTIESVMDCIAGGYSMRTYKDSIFIIKHQKTQNTIWRTDKQIYPNYAKSYSKF